MKEGPGILEDADGIRYEGNFHEDEKDGEFTERDKNGSVVRTTTYSKGVITSPNKNTNEKQ